MDSTKSFFVLSNKHVINREGMHKYFKERFQDDLWCEMEYEDDMLCA